VKKYHADIEGKIPFMATHMLLGWKCGPAIKLTLYQVLAQNYQFLQSDGIQGADWKTSKRAPMFKNFD
jgi:hypothetical protein